MNFSECFKGLCNIFIVVLIWGVGWICSDKIGILNIFVIIWYKYGRWKVMENLW